MGNGNDLNTGLQQTYPCLLANPVFIRQENICSYIVHYMFKHWNTADMSMCRNYVFLVSKSISNTHMHYLTDSTGFRSYFSHVLFSFQRTSVGQLHASTASRAFWGSMFNRFLGSRMHGNFQCVRTEHISFLRWWLCSRQDYLQFCSCLKKKHAVLYSSARMLFFPTRCRRCVIKWQCCCNLRVASNFRIEYRI